MTTEINKKAADLLEKLAADYKAVTEENANLKFQVEKQEKQIKLASLKFEKGIEPKLAEQLSSMNRDEYNKVSNILGITSGSDFGVAVKTASSSSVSELEEARQRVIDRLRS